MSNPFNEKKRAKKFNVPPDSSPGSFILWAQYMWPGTVTNAIASRRRLESPAVRRAYSVVFWILLIPIVLISMGGLVIILASPLAWIGIALLVVFLACVCIGYLAGPV